MSDSSAQLRRTIASAADLQSVVRTMKAMSASSIGQYEQSVRSLTDYHRAVELGLGACLRGHAAVPKQPGRHQHKHTVAVVFGSDQGLVGQFNESIAAFTLGRLSALRGPDTVWCVGERVHVRLSDAGLAVQPPLAVPQSVKGITPLVGEILLRSQRMEDAPAATELLIFHNRPASGAICEPVVQRLLPLDDDWRDTMTGKRWPTRNLPQVVCGGAETLRVLIGEYLFVSLFRACAESLASENASRLSAMERADKNIAELQSNLQGRFNRLRQSSIDAELFDVVSGFEALASAKKGRHGAADSADTQSRSNGDG
jgi:F-type H+-transporting ATPase subunit gamma